MEMVVTTGDVQSYSQNVTTNKPTPCFLQSGCPSCRPTNSVRALKGKILLDTLHPSRNFIKCRQQVFSYPADSQTDRQTYIQKQKT